MKKLFFLVSIIAVLLAIFVLTICIPKSYEYNYDVNGFKVKEKFSKKEKLYTFDINDDESNYKYAIISKYSKKRGLINKITKKGSCLFISSEHVQNFTICKDNDLYYTSFIDSIIEYKDMYSYDKISIYELLDKRFLIWNYTDFIYLSSNSNKHIKLFSNDVYKLDIVAKIQNSLVVADYDQKYKFNKFYVIDSKNGNVSSFNVNRDLYLNSYILGTYKKNIYLYDAQKEIQYAINPFNKSMKKSAYGVYNNGEFEKVSINKLNKLNVSFVNDTLFNYFIKDNKLFYKTPVNEVLVSYMNVTNIVEANDKEAFFVSGDTLYFVDISKGIKPLLNYSEWNFNSSNIYVF